MLFEVVYRDPLANQLTEGWVYRTLVIYLHEGESIRHVSGATVMLVGQLFQLSQLTFQAFWPSQFQVVSQFEIRRP